MGHERGWPIAPDTRKWPSGVACIGDSPRVGGDTVKARIDALALRLVDLMPYGCAVLMGMLLQQLIEGAK